MALPARALPLVLLACTPLAGCSIDFDGFLRPVSDLDAGPGTDTGITPPTDTGITPPTDMGGPPPVDTGVLPRDTGNPLPRDTGNPLPTDTGNPLPMGCPAPYVAAAAEELAQGTGKLVRWSFVTGQRCPDLPLQLARPRALGMVYDDLAAVDGQHYAIASEQSLALANTATGSIENLVTVTGSPRSIFDIRSNGVGSFAVAFTNRGSSPVPGEVGEVIVYDHTRGMEAVQRWPRNMLVPYAIPGSSVWITAFPGNQGQSTRIGNPMSGEGYSYFVQTPSSMGMQPQSPIPSLANRPGLVSAYAYRTVDRRGHYAVTASSSSGRWVHLAHAAPSAPPPSTFNLVMASCGTPACTGLSRSVAHPTELTQAVVICEVGGATHLVRFGGPSTGCNLVSHTDIGPGNWRLNDLTVVVRDN